MNDEIFQLLRSKDPEDRKKAVRALAQIRDREVLRYLATVYKEDPDPEVRDLAVRAGKHVKKQLEAGEWMAEAASRSEDYDDAPAQAARPAKTAAEEMTATRAKALMDKAMDASVRLDYKTAQKQAQQAFTLYPELRNDPYYANLAAEIMGMPVEEAVDALLSGEEVAAPAAGKRKRKNDDVSRRDVSWTDALIDVGVYGLVVAGTTFLSMMLMMGLFSNMFRSVAEMPEMYGEDTAALLMLADMGSQLGFGIGLIYGLIAGVFAMIGYMLWGGAIHFGATTFLGGDGSYRALLHNMLMPSAAQLLLSTVFSLIGVFMVFSAFPTDPAVWQAYAETGTGLESVDAAFGTFGFLNMVSFLIAMGFVFWLSKAIGDTYAFGTAKGCGSIVVGYIAMLAVACGCYFAVLSSLLPTLLQPIY